MRDLEVLVLGGILGWRLGGHVATVASGMLEFEITYRRWTRSYGHSHG